MKRRIHTNRPLIVILLSLISLSFAYGDNVPLSRSELRQKFGQGINIIFVVGISVMRICNSEFSSKSNSISENTTYGDGKSCYRPCDGTKMTCYFEFNVENYDTMSGYVGFLAYLFNIHG